MGYSFDRDLFLKPFYKGNISYFETVLPLKGEDNQLLFPIKKIISVTNFGLDILYQEGKDYYVKNGKLIIPETSDIPTFPFEDYYRDEICEHDIQTVKERCPYHFDKPKYLFFGESNLVSKHQIAITYEHEEKWDGYIPICQSQKLKNFIKKLKNKEETTIVFYGDSITVGCNASGSEYGGNVKPFTEPWPIMVYKYLEEKYQTKINYVNTALGGMNTEWGLNNYQERVNTYHPDLLVLAFGMNDGDLEAKKHVEMIKKIIEGVKKENPEVEIILVASIVPNIESTWFHENSLHYVEEYLSINLPFVAVTNMTSLHLDLLKRKRYKDMTGNNINHPNDYLIRMYAQNILGTIEER